MRTVFRSRSLRWMLLCLCLQPLLTAAAFPQEASSERPSTVQIPPQSNIVVRLAKSLDAKKSKVGDEVVVQVMTDLKVDDKVILPKGSKIYGHLVEAKANSKESLDSLLKVNFERASAKTAGNLLLSATIRALCTPVDARTADMSDLRRGPDGFGIAGTQVNDPALQLTPDMQGIIGYKDLELEGSLVRSRVRNVHLEAGSQMVLQLSGK